jgi:hypothetical protein
MEFSEIEIECVLSVLCKPQLENCLLIEELSKIMENFENYDGDEGGPGPGLYPPVEEEVVKEEDEESSPLQDQINEEDEAHEESSPTVKMPNKPSPDDGKKKKKLDYDSLDEKSLLILYKLAK